MPADNNAAGKTFRRSWADMNSDDSSMGAPLPSMTRRKEDPGCTSVQLPKSGKGDPSSFSLICDDSYAPNKMECENRRDGLNDAFRSVHITNERSTGGQRTGGDFSCFGFLLPKSDETYDGDTRSRMMGGPHASSDESKLGKRLLSAVAGQSDFSSMMQTSEASQPSKFRKIDEGEVSVERQATSFTCIDPLAPTRRTMTDGAEKARALNSKRLQVPSQASMSMLSESPSSRLGGGSEGDNEWEARFQQREKQIELGKKTKGYKIYTKEVPKEKRTVDHPHTPDSREMCSKRQFDGKLHKWRKGIHRYDDSAMS